MHPAFEGRGKRLRKAISRVRISLLWARPPKPEVQPVYTQSRWDILPIEIQVEIFALCKLQDLDNLQLVSRAFLALLRTNEGAISRLYLRRRRRGTLPRARLSEDVRHSRRPEDDVILLSDLFPPTRRDEDGGLVFSFAYLKELKLKQEVCRGVAVHLGEMIVENYIRSGHIDKKLASSKAFKREKEMIVSRLDIKLTPMIYYLHFFLESYARKREEHQNSLLIDYDAGRLPVAMYVSDRIIAYRGLQREIMQSAPFTDRNVLVATHHAFLLLTRYLRQTVVPTPASPAGLSDLWISLLLSHPSPQRIAQFFAAEKGSKRKEFMKHMQADWDAMRFNTVAKTVYQPVIFESRGRGEGYLLPPPVREIWFVAAREEFARRGEGEHRCDDVVEVWFNQIVRISCERCSRTYGWDA